MSTKLDIYTTKRRGRVLNGLFTAACFLATITCVLVLLGLIWNIINQGQDWLDWDFIKHLPSRFPEKAGIKTALWGSIWLIGLTALFSVPLGVGAAVYLEEYAPRTRWRKLIQLNIANLAGVPSIVYGILGLGLFVRALAFERSVLSGALTLTLVVLPIIILASQEALRAVPDSIRRSAYALGATRWQTVWHQVLPASLPGIMTGVILSLSRALGEAAPLLVVGAMAYVPFVPEKLSDEFTALPIQIFNWTSRPQEEFHHLAAAGILVLLVVLVSMNAVAVFVRHRYGKKIRW
ncbi:Phosphate transport system permease protein PstA [Gimesia panareensis]|uniref:Phosphate transport system permease protein PstA n=1 Tax=Gimesia panareensis TaxID=2527978 RepID=A0A517Q102_9PLAN|nr:phosphate ABC transporter permease PstA [Gimesia panareensis]QDT25291.1 Phosphate transport system permease protein PstA [Gimesia panareensis]